MVGVDHHHLGGAARGAAGLDRAAARSPILRKLIRPLERPPPESRSPSPRKREKFEPVPGAIFEQPRLAYPQVHDAALVDEVVLDALDEAGVRLRMP